jgi:hypothetical protein
MGFNGGDRHLPNLFAGYGSRRAESERILLLVLPVILSVAFRLISDIDSPRGGLAHVRPQNLRNLAQSLQEHYSGLN